MNEIDKVTEEHGEYPELVQRGREPVDKELH